MYESTCQSCGLVIKSCEMNQKYQLMEPMYVTREKGGNFLSYVDFSKICNVIKYFYSLKKIGKEDITFPISSSSRAIEWQN